ncbi:MAG: potassium channel family protein [Candidatus Saccharibacteria bacterium]
MQETFDKHVYRLLLLAAAITVGTGTIVFHIVEHLTWVNAYYFSVVTLSTVGYGDITPHTTLGKIFTTFYIFIGVGILTTFLSYTVRRSGARYIQNHPPKTTKK